MNRKILNNIAFYCTLSVLWVIFNTGSAWANTISSSQTTVCPSAPLSITGSIPTGCVMPFTYTWQTSSDNSSWSSIPGETNQNLSTSISSNTYFRRVVDDGNPGCSNVNSNVLAVSTLPLPSTPINPLHATICANNPALLAADPVPSNASLSWYDAAVGGNFLGTGNQYTPAPPSTTTYYVASVNSCGESSPRLAVTATVNILPDPTAVSSPTRCGPGNVTLTATPGAGANDIRWFYPSNTTIGQGSPFTYAVSGTITVYAVSLNTLDGCTSNQVSTVITVHPLLGNNSILTDQIICTGATPPNFTGSAPSGGNGSYTYTWESTTDFVNWFSAGQTGSDYTPNSHSQTTVYRRIVNSSLCNPITSNTLVIQVDNLNGNNIIGNDQTICSGFSPALFTGSTPTGGNGNFTYSWQSSTNNTVFNAIPGSTAQSFTSPVLTSSTYFRRIVTSGVCTASTSNSLYVLVIPPVTNNTIGSAQTICSGSAPVGFSGSSPGGGTGVYAYQWQSSSNNSTFNPISGATNQTYTHGSMTSTLYFRRVITSVCTDNSVSFQVLVNANIGNNSINSNQTVCINVAGSQINGIIPNGGNGAYTYIWESSLDNIAWASAGGNGQNYSPPAISQNTYFRRVVTSPPCLPSSSTSVSFLVNSVISGNTIGQNQTVCSNQATQMLTGSNPSGGNGVYTYTWQSSTDNSNWTNVTNGTGINYSPGILSASRYWRRVVSSAPCPGNTSSSVSILVYTALSNTTISANQTICTGTSPNPITGLAVAGGTGVYSYQWQSSVDNVNFNNIPDGTTSTYGPGVLTVNTYYRRNINSLPCSNTSNTITITINQPLGNNTTGNAQTICSGTAPAILTGSIPTGGVGVFTYNWQSSSDNVTWTNVTGGGNQNLSPGVLTGDRYFRRVVTSGACPALTSTGFFITVNPGIGNNILTGAQTLCSGAQPDEITGALPTGGSGVYTYSWQTSVNNLTWGIDIQETDQNYYGVTLSTSTYFRRVVSGAPCPASTSAALLITIQNTIGNNSIVANQTICTGTAPNQFTGSLPTGGSGVFSYEWLSSSDDFNFNLISGATLSNYQATTLTAMTYYRRVVISGVCPPLTTMSIAVSINESIGGNIIGNNQSICAGNPFLQLTGSLPTGGSGSYTYVWQTSINNTNWFTVTGSVLQDQPPFTLNASTYFRRVVSSAPCPAHTSSAVYIFAEPAIGNNTISVNQTICTGNVANALTGTVPTGGDGNFAYYWESSLNTIAWAVLTGETTTGYTLPALTVTTYYRRMAGSGLCVPVSSNLIEIQVDNFIAGNIVGANQTLCLATTPLALTGPVPSGGNGGFIYLWQSSSDSLTWAVAGGVNNLQNYNSGPLFSNIYFRRIVESGVCNMDTSMVITLTMENYMSGNILSAAQTICAGTAPATFTATLPSGGSGIYTFTWETSNDNLNWGTIPGATDINYTHGNLSTVLYFRRVTASGLCPVLPSNTVLISVQQGIGNNFVGADQALCEGLTPSLLTGDIPSGGNGIYTYLWESSTDMTNWSTVSGVSNNIDYLPTQPLSVNTYYRRTVASGVCANSISNPVTIRVYLIPTVTVPDIEVCLGQSTILTATPSAPGGFFLWNTGAATPGINVGPFTTTTYTVHYTLNGCISPQGAGVVTVNPLPVPVITPLGPTILCPSGSVVLSASGGSSYLWSTGINTNTLQVSSPGTYRVVVTDIKGCIDSTIIAITQPAPVAITPIILNPSCFGLQDGSISLNVTGGTLPYAFTWNTNPIQNIRNIFNLTIGTYTVSVSDFVGCQASATIVLTEPRPLAIHTTHNTIACTPLLDNGVANAFVTGGVSPYLYAWSTNPVQNNSSAFNLTPGSYTVNVTDFNGCVIADTITLVSDISPSVIASRDTFVCANSGGIQVYSFPSGGIGPYTSVWSQSPWIIPGSISDEYIPDPFVNPDSSGWYYVQVFGSNGCPSNKDSLYVTVYALPIANAGSDLNFCEEAPGVFLQGSVGNPIGGYSVQWMPSAGLYCDTCLVTYAQPLQTTIYTLRITNTETGCKSDSTTLNTLSTALITVKDLPVVNAGRDTVICLADSASLLGTVTGSGPLYTWDWSPSMELNDRNLQTPNAAPASSTTYFVVATSNGCQSHADSMVVTVIAYPVVTAGQQKNICEGDSIQLAGQVQQGVAQNFLWVPATGLSDSTALNPMASPQVTTTYTLYAFNQGCPSPPASMLMIVKPVPQADAGLDTFICADGDSIMLNASFTGGYFPFRYGWYPPGGLERDDIFNPMAKPIATQFYYFRVSSGTAPDLCETIDSVFISVIPSMNLNLSVDTNIICPGQSVQLNSSGGIGNPTFIWSPVTGISNPAHPSPVASPEVPTRYYVTVSEGGCSDTDYVDIYVHPRPSAAFDISQAIGCAPVDVRVQNLSSSAMSYQWRVPGTNYVSNEKEPVFRFEKSGTYTLELIVRGQGGCVDTVRHNLPIQVKAKADVKILTDPGLPLEFSGVKHEIRFEDLTPGANEWFWDFGDGTFSNDKTPYHTYNNYGTYTIKLRVKTLEGCDGEGSVGPVTIRESVLNIPNVFTPNGDGMNDFFDVGYNGDELFYLQIFDRWGTKYFETRNRTQLWNGRDLNNQEAAAGVYFYTVEVGTQKYSGSLTLMR